MTLSPITILLAEDHPVVREGLRTLLLEEQDMRVIAEAGDGRMAIDLTRILLPDVVVMDLTLPEIDGLEATRQIRLMAPSIKVLILSSHDDKAYVRHVQSLGASGYLVKQTDILTLPDAIRAAHQGKPFIYPGSGAN